LKELKLTVAIPSSFLSDVKDLRSKTVKVGFIARSAAIFRVDRILIYSDERTRSAMEDVNTMKDILAYMETPQYLRKYLFKRKASLKYAGILPPLATPHHPLKSKLKGLREGEVREGVVVAKKAKGVLVDIGVEKPILLKEKANIGERLTLRITRKNGRVEGRRIGKQEVKDYWGYMVEVSEHPLGDTLRKNRESVKVLTSRYGEPLREKLNQILSAWRKKREILLVFGGPYRGVLDMLSEERYRPEEVSDFIVNTLPNQGTRTVRTEEAVHATLAILNLFRDP